MTTDNLLEILEQYLDHNQIIVRNLSKDTFVSGESCVSFKIDGCVEIPLGILPANDTCEWAVRVETRYDTMVDVMFIKKPVNTSSYIMKSRNRRCDE